MGKAFVLGLLIGLAFALIVYIKRKSVEEKILDARELEQRALLSVKSELYVLADDIGKGLHAIEAIPSKLKIAIGKIL